MTAYPKSARGDGLGRGSPELTASAAAGSRPSVITAHRSRDNSRFPIRVLVSFMEFDKPPIYNIFWKEAQHPAGLLSISCLSYNKGDQRLFGLPCPKKRLSTISLLQRSI